MNTNTGDKLRARIMYKYAAPPGAKPGAPKRSIAPALLEPALPTFLGLQAAAAAAPGQALGITALDRLLTYHPSRMHSG